MKVTVKKKSNAVPVLIGTEYIKLEAALKQAGLSEEELEKMWHSNARRVLQAVLAE